MENDEKELDYARDLRVGYADELEEQWEKQPILFMRYGEEWAAAVRRRDDAKEALEVAKADADKDVRINFEKYDFDKKPTEAAIASTVAMNLAVRKAGRKLNEAQEEMNVLAVAKMAFEHKKKALENRTDLFLKGASIRPRLQNPDERTDPDQPFGSPERKRLQQSERTKARLRKRPPSKQ